MGITAICTALGFTQSNGEAKRKIAEGAVKIDDQPVKDPSFIVIITDGESKKLSLGKKKHAVLTA